MPTWQRFRQLRNPGASSVGICSCNQMALSTILPLIFFMTKQIFSYILIKKISLKLRIYTEFFHYDCNYILRLIKLPSPSFLAPTGAQEMLIYVRSSVRSKLVQSCQSSSFQVRDQSEHSESIRVIQSEQSSQM